MASERVNEFVTVNKYISEGEEGTVYYAELEHAGLKEHKLLSAPERPILVSKLRNQLDAWEEQWLIQQGLKAPEESTSPRRSEFSEFRRQAKVQKAEEETLKAQKKIEEIKELLSQAFHNESYVDWEAMKDFQEFTQIPPLKPAEPHLTSYPKEPHFQDEEFSPRLNVIDRVITPFKTKKEDKAYKNFQLSYKKWREVCQKIDKENAVLKERYEEELRSWEKEMNAWKAEKEKFYDEKQEINDQVDQFKRNYESKDPDAIREYCRMILDSARYPETFPKEFTLDFVPHDQTLLVEYAVPSIHDMPILKGVEYLPAKDELGKIYLDDKERTELYDNALYHITLSVIYALFKADQADAIRAIRFSGWIASADPVTHQKEKKCILSLHTTKEAFMRISLLEEEAEKCFRQLGGVTHTQLISLGSHEPVIEANERIAGPDEAVAEIVERDEEERIEEEDQREVDNAEETTPNLAAMESEDFKQLIGDMLEKELKPYGGEVSILQTGGADELQAVALDPDPIRGGKIIIHGKLSVHPISVLEVRELFGNVMKEGALKGIFITTSNYATEARNFASEKPLSLLNGSALLSLLEKHGQKFRIDLDEVKQ